MHFLTRAQVKTIAEFRAIDQDYVCLERSANKVGSVVVTFWMKDGAYYNMLITPEGDLQRV